MDGISRPDGGSQPVSRVRLLLRAKAVIRYRSGILASDAVTEEPFQRPGRNGRSAPDGMVKRGGLWETPGKNMCPFTTAWPRGGFV